jgi:hypothetical protein
MSKNKKSFLLYCDLIHTVDQLTNEQAGDLFKHILRYVNDQEPQTDNVITRIAFEPIKQSLMRDLVKYKSICERNSDNAKKRWDATASDGIRPLTKNADSDSDRDRDRDSERDKDKKVFKKPTIEDVKTYMEEQGMNDISERWMSHYESNGWLVGKNKMKDWKASVRTWKLNNLQTEEIKTNKPKIATL